MTGALREPLWLCSHPLTSPGRGGHTPSGGCYAACGLTGAVHSGLPQRKCPPEQPTASGTALIPTRSACLHKHWHTRVLGHAGPLARPSYRERVTHTPCPSRLSHTRTALHLDGLLHPPQEGDDARKLTQQALAHTSPGRELTDTQSPGAAGHRTSPTPPGSCTRTFWAADRPWPHGHLHTYCPEQTRWALAHIPDRLLHTPATDSLVHTRPLTGSRTHS